VARRRPLQVDARCERALDLAIGEGEAPGALRIVEAPRSMGVRVLIVVGAVAGLAIAAGIIWLFVAGT